MRRASSPAIHILAGLKVCIQAMTPMTLPAAFASSMTLLMLAESTSVGLQTTVTGMLVADCRPATTAWDCSATCRRVSSP